MAGPMKPCMASAPARADIAGGTLDIWPLYLFYEGARTVNAAVNLRATTSVTPLDAGIEIVSIDTGTSARAADVASIEEHAHTRLVVQILKALGVHTGLRIETTSRVPAGSGLGGSSALAVTIAAAVAGSISKDLSKRDLRNLVRDAEAQVIRVPTGIQDYEAAIHGGVLEVALNPGEIETLRLVKDEAFVDERILLVDAGLTRFSGLNNWEMFKAQVDGVGEVRSLFGEIVRAAAAAAAAIISEDEEGLIQAVAREWKARRALAPGVATPEVDRIVEIASAHRGSAKVCGAGGGGIVLAVSPRSSRAVLAADLARQGFSVLDARVDRVGLKVGRGTV
jgi:D-glycero-alpha-D-manno-heptose-7-phosphate kinase